MAHLVALVGGECTGKSTLAAALADELPGHLVPEALRVWTTQHGRTPLAHEQREIARLQVAAEDAARRDREWVICDPATLMTAVYSELYFEDTSLTEEALAHADAAYKCIVWCDIDLPWTAEPGIRDGIEWRAKAHDALAVLLPRLTVPVHMAHGPVDTRVATTVSYLRSLFEK